MSVIAGNQKDKSYDTNDSYVNYFYHSPSQQIFQTYCSFMLMDITEAQLEIRAPPPTRKFEALTSFTVFNPHSFTSFSWCWKISANVLCHSLFAV